MRALQFSEFGSVSNLRLIELPDPKADSATAIVKIAAGAISPSDVKNVEGKMEHTTLPRVPGHAVHEEFFKRHMATKGTGLAEACVAIIGQLAAVA